MMMMISASSMTAERLNWKEEERVGSVLNLTEPMCSQKRITFIKIVGIKTQNRADRRPFVLKLLFAIKLGDVAHIYRAMKPQLALQQRISKRISVRPGCKGSEDQVSYLSGALDGW